MSTKQQDNITKEAKAKPEYNIAVIIFARSLVWLRDRISVGLAKIGVRPNHLTVLGTIFTLIAGYYLATGVGHSWSEKNIPPTFFAGIFLFLSCAMDMLDGSLARIGNMKTVFGGILDSSLDRVSDIAIFGGIALGYARVGNLTFVLISLIALTNAVMISYIKARSECVLPKYTAGFWQRGERMAGILISAFASNLPVLVVIMAIFPAITAMRRLYFCYLISNNRPTPGPVNNPLMFWRYPRGSWPYVITCAVFILSLAFIKIPPVNFLFGK